MLCQHKLTDCVLEPWLVVHFSVRGISSGGLLLILVCKCGLGLTVCVGDSDRYE